MLYNGQLKRTIMENLRVVTPVSETKKYIGVKSVPGYDVMIYSTVPFPFQSQ